MLTLPAAASIKLPFSLQPCSAFMGQLNLLRLEVLHMSELQGGFPPSRNPPDPPRPPLSISRGVYELENHLPAVSGIFSAAPLTCQRFNETSLLEFVPSSKNILNVLFIYLIFKCKGSLIWSFRLYASCSLSCSLPLWPSFQWTQTCFRNLFLSQNPSVKSLDEALT